MSKDSIGYRVVHSKIDDGFGGKEDSYSIQEVYFDEEGVVYAQSTDLEARAGDIKSLEYMLQDMMDALQLPVVDELQNKLSESKDEMPLILCGEPDDTTEQMELFENDNQLELFEDED
tara:strand:+ start:657 stop:1010 length:354 start_codon:yes stop_codon:yes gene_type:complete